MTWQYLYGCFKALAKCLLTKMILDTLMSIKETYRVAFLNCQISEAQINKVCITIFQSISTAILAK